MKVLRRLDGVLLVLMTVACACQPVRDQLTDAERQAISDSVSAGMVSYANALTDLDSTRVLTHYVAGPACRLVSDGNTSFYVAMQKLIGGLRGTFQSSVVKWDTVAVTVLGRDAALVYAPFRRTDTDKQGTVARIRGIATWVWVRRDGAWRMLYGHGDHYPDTSTAR